MYISTSEVTVVAAACALFLLSTGNSPFLSSPIPAYLSIPCCALRRSWWLVRCHGNDTARGNLPKIFIDTSIHDNQTSVSRMYSYDDHVIGIYLQFNLNPLSQEEKDASVLV